LVFAAFNWSSAVPIGTDKIVPDSVAVEQRTAESETETISDVAGILAAGI
jgi:hypothetical protein